jgi:mono/diheme cytochrome c family protein
LLGATLSLAACGNADAAGKPSAKALFDTSFADTVQPFLNTYCVKCHGAHESKGERRFDRMASEIRSDNDLVDYQGILDQLNLGEMPPKKAKQPSDQQRRQIVTQLTQAIDRHHQTSKSNTGATVLRRLNSREYRNTVRDLLHLNMTMFDPTQGFPRDQTAAHLDNVGETLVTSGHLLAKYLEAAEQVVDKAMFPLKQPEVQKWVFRDGFRQQPEIDQVHRKTNQYQHMTLYDVVGADKHEGAYGPIHAFAEGVPYDGYYQLRIKAEALHRRNPYDAEFLGTDPDELFRLGIVAGNRLVGALHKPQPVEPLLAEVELADEAQWYTVRIWLDAGFTPRFTFRNGLMDVRNLWSRIQNKYPDLFPERKSKGIVEARFNTIKYGELPQIHIHEIEIEGPLYDEWPTAGQRAVLGDDFSDAVQSGALPKKQMRQHLTRFASEAYRHPVQAAEIDRVMDVIAFRQTQGRSAIEAYSDGLKAVLCSSEFLFLEPIHRENLSGQTESTGEAGLASRLSYFLWASMPDAELQQLVQSDSLKRPKVLTAQVKRLLNDPRSNAFVQGFLDSWLTMRDLGATPPDRRDFGDFYHYDLDGAMRQETFLFTRHLIDQNLSITNFLDSDFTFVNKPLARHYDIEPPAEPGFHRVKLSDPRRGGLLGQASILTLTANGIDTSPVVRGVWLLENVLGTPPSPPPPDVEPLDPDIRGAKTIREQLRKHRDTATCNDCHRKIDPLGFALENFDPVGRWRTAYDRQGKIDASGQLPGGQQFDNVEGLKTILMDRRGQFAKALAEKLLSYAIGRHLQPSDRLHTDRILQQLDAQGNGFHDLIRLVVLSDPFRSP